MIDALTLALTHSLMALAAWLLVMREDLDVDGAEAKPAPRWRRKRDSGRHPSGEDPGAD